jgi:hypothetical protein
MLIVRVVKFIVFTLALCCRICRIYRQVRWLGYGRFRDGMKVDLYGDAVVRYIFTLFCTVICIFVRAVMNRQSITVLVVLIDMWHRNKVSNSEFLSVHIEGCFGVTRRVMWSVGRYPLGRQRCYRLIGKVLPRLASLTGRPILLPTSRLRLSRTFERQNNGSHSLQPEAIDYLKH